MSTKTQRELAFLLTGKDVSASKAMKGVGREMQTLEHIAGKAGSNVARNLERGVLLGATAAAGAIGYAINAAMDFETSSTSVAKAVGEGWEKIVAANREMALSIPVDVNTLNDMSAAAAAMGVTGDDVTSFTKTLALLTQTADDVDAESGATFLGHLRTNMSLTGTEIEHTGDLVTHLGNNSAATEGEILAMAEGVSGAAGFINASIDDVVAWSAAMASAGEEAEAGGSTIQRVWIDAAKFVSEGGDGLKTLAGISGETMGDFKKDFEKDGAGTLAKFVTKLGALDTATQLAVLSSLGWDDIRITRGLGKLLANVDNLTDAYSETGDAAGAAAAEAAIRFATTDSLVRLFKQNVDDAAITIGQELLPVMVELAQDATTFLKGHQPEIKQFAQDLGAGIREAVTWAEKLDWDAIGNALQTGAGAAKTLVDAFLGMPPWAQQLLIGGFVANKLTGGAVSDLLKFSLKTMAVQAGVVNVSGGLAGGAGAAGGSGMLGLLMKGLQVAAVAEIANLVEPITTQAGIDLHNKLGLPTIKPDDVAWPFGPKNTPTILADVFGGNGILGGTPAATAPHEAETGGLSPEDRQILSDQKRATDDLGIYERQAGRDAIAASNREINAVERTRLAILGITLKPPTVVLVGSTVVNVSAQSVSGAQGTVSTWTGSTKYATAV